MAVIQPSGGWVSRGLQLLHSTQQRIFSSVCTAKRNSESSAASFGESDASFRDKSRFTIKLNLSASRRSTTGTRWSSSTHSNRATRSAAWGRRRGSGLVAFCKSDLLGFVDSECAGELHAEHGGARAQRGQVEGGERHLRATPPTPSRSLSSLAELLSW